jgi:hypothetical protein
LTYVILQPDYNSTILAVNMSAVDAAGWVVRTVTLIALACTFISILAKHPTVTFSPVGFTAPVLSDAAP